MFGVFLVLLLLVSIPSIGRRTLSRAFCEIHLLPRVTLKLTSGVEKASETRRGKARSIRRESFRGMAKRKPDISRVFGRRRRESERFETKRGTALRGGNQRYLGKVWVSRHRQTVSRRRARGRFCRVKAATSEESIRIVVSANDAHHQQRGKKSQSRENALDGNQPKSAPARFSDVNGYRRNARTTRNGSFEKKSRRRRRRRIGGETSNLRSLSFFRSLSLVLFLRGASCN